MRHAPCDQRSRAWQRRSAAGESRQGVGADRDSHEAAEDRVGVHQAAEGHRGKVPQANGLCMLGLKVLHAFSFRNLDHLTPGLI